MNNKDKCPYCGCEETVIGKQNGYASVNPDKVLSFKTVELIHVICLNCGTVIRSYVEKPKKLVVNK